ncbi:MAG: hypothetical protein LBJ14_11155 [Desulfarculales bacterium]|jgi:hypothetical protein|nr:hypothetical protein [Desulfarculales bacterium]
MASITNTYVYTYVNAYGQESAASAPATITFDAAKYPYGYNISLISSAASGAVEYRYYKLFDGVYGYLGSAYSAAYGAWMFTDQGQSPNMTITPPLAASSGHLYVNIYVDTSSGASHQEVEFSYVFTYVTADGNESLPGGEWTGTGKNLRYAGDRAEIYIPYVAGATEYKLYKMYAGSYGYVGSVLPENLGKPFIDENITPDAALSPPRNPGYFQAPGDYPALTCFYQQRLCFASSYNQPQTVWMSRSGNFENFSGNIPVRDDDAIDITLASNKVSMPAWLTVLRSLVAGTGNDIWDISAGSGGVLTAKDAAATLQSNRGCAYVPAIAVSNQIIFVVRGGRKVSVAGYDFGADSYIDSDISVYAAHLFSGRQVRRMAYQSAPYSVVWLLMSDGQLLSLTYIQEHQICAWATHNTEGKIIDLCVLPGASQDILFVLVKRGGNYCLERMELEFEEDSTVNAFFVDSGVTYQGPPARTLRGFPHLEGMKVKILADGAVVPDRTVENGSVTLDYPASTVHIGLQYSAGLETLPLQFVSAPGSTAGRKKRISAMDIMFYKTATCQIGHGGSDKTVPLKWRTVEPYGAPVNLLTVNKYEYINTGWDDEVNVYIKSDQPLPLTVLGLNLQVEVN